MRDLINAIKVIYKYNSMDLTEFKAICVNYLRVDINTDEIGDFRFTGLNNVDYFKLFCDNGKAEYEGKLHNIVLIPKYEKVDDVWNVLNYESYIITYILYGKNKFKVIVNGRLTTGIIKFNMNGFPFKDILLSSIANYQNNILVDGVYHTEGVSLKWFNKSNNDQMKHNVTSHLLPINREMSRDRLTEFGLI